MPTPVSTPQKEESPGKAGSAAAGEAFDIGDLEALCASSEDQDGVETEEHVAFQEQLKVFFHERNMELRVPRFYGCNVNLLKLWRVVCFYGGYDKVTAGKLWRAVGNYFNPPKSCTTLSWSFRGFYERSLLDFERVHGVPDRHSLGTLPNSAKEKGDLPAESGKGGPATDAAQLVPKVEVSVKGEDMETEKEKGKEKKDKEKEKREKEKEKEREKGARKGKESPGRTGHKAGHRGAEEASQGEADAGRTPDGGSKRLKRNPSEGQTRPTGTPQVVRNSSQKPQGAGPGGRTPGAPTSGSGDGAGAGAGAGPGTGKRKAIREVGGLGGGAGEKAKERERGGEAAVVWHVGEECPWVRVNVRRSHDCFEVFALVPGLLREEVKVQVESPGRLVIAGTPANEENPWGVRRFKKIVILPGSVVASETSAIVSLHGQLYVHLPLAPAQERRDRAGAGGADKSSSGGRSG